MTDIKEPPISATGDGTDRDRTIDLKVFGIAAVLSVAFVVVGASLMKELRRETFDSTLPPRVRRAVLHADRFPDGP